MKNHDHHREKRRKRWRWLGEVPNADRIQRKNPSFGIKGLEVRGGGLKLSGAIAIVGPQML